MEGEANLPAPPSNLARPVATDSIHHRPSFTSTSNTSSSSSSPPSFIRHVQAAFKRHRPLGMMQSNNIKPRRMLVPQRGTPKDSVLNMDPKLSMKKSQEDSSLHQRLKDCVALSTNVASGAVETPEDASITPPSEWGFAVNTHEGSFKPLDSHNDQNREAALDMLEMENALFPGGQKKVHFAVQNDSRFQDMEWDPGNNTEAPTAISQDLQQHNSSGGELNGCLIPESGISSSRNLKVSDQWSQFRSFLQNEMSHPVTQSSAAGTACATTTMINMTQSSAAGTSCATTTMINPGSAPMPNSTTNFPKPHHLSNTDLVSDIMRDAEMNIPAIAEEDVIQPSHSASRCLIEQASSVAQVPISTSENKYEDKKAVPIERKQSYEQKFNGISRDSSLPDNHSIKESASAIPSEGPLSKVQSSDMKLEPKKLEKQEKGAGGKSTSTSRRKNYDADLFFKVNGKLYQRLGKIGSGGSSEVHKVISSDCTIYALKKIKLKGRDYATAYGFCQEIGYLNKLKGKNNIIQLIDYEVTDKALLQEVISGTMSNKDARVKEDGHIYMVLEYGEIDLAHMLSQKWKELDSSDSTIDENWLRFYWQQILLAVNTIHEERIVHSDLKPANFLLVKGSLKLIDFGIAKAIMSDTTNIQRDSQVGTLSYMSPEAFMCNETDANGKTIKCGRPSDIWSLGCILYQMVYGRTPFSEYKTFWAKFKVITDPNHEIAYEPVSNPWLLDLMKKCLAWDRNQRWRIPQLLQHPFLVPPVPCHTSPPHPGQSCKLLQLIASSCKYDEKALMLCSKLEQMLENPKPSVPSQSSISPDEQHKLLCDMSNLCSQINEQLAKLHKDP